VHRNLRHADGRLRPITKILVILAIPLAIPLIAAGYARHVWNAEQQRWADAREATELRYWQMIDLNCQFGELTDPVKCSEALNNLTERSAFVSRSMAELAESPL